MALRDSSLPAQWRSSCAMPAREPSGRPRLSRPRFARSNSASARPGGGYADDPCRGAGARALARHLIVLGGGYVGLELSRAFRRFGSNVTVIEHGAQLASREDPYVAAELKDLLADEGIEVVLDATT